jgi:3-phenylpropionate/cinnamic acid dioxygenase small subunit
VRTGSGQGADMTYVVTTNLDITDPDDGLLSLREALVLTNARPNDDDTFFDDCSKANCGSRRM